MSTESSRERILARVRSAVKETDFPLPEVPNFAVAGDPVANFIGKLEGFDGKALRFASRAEAIEWLRGNINFDGKTVFSALPDFRGNFTSDDVADPHAAAAIDVCVGEVLLGVGETGSVWVTDEAVGKAACALMSTDLYLLLDGSRIVDGIHTAYSMLDIRSTPYGSFFTGPSATADIEAVHITGAQGEISLTVLIYGL